MARGVRLNRGIKSFFFLRNTNINTGSNPCLDKSSVKQWIQGKCIFGVQLRVFSCDGFAYVPVIRLILICILSQRLIKYFLLIKKYIYEVCKENLQKLNNCVSEPYGHTAVQKTCITKPLWAKVL